MIKMRLIFGIIVLAAALPCIAQVDNGGLVQVRLLVDRTAIEPGQPFRLGIVYDISPGWHIYWTNPGDAGTATHVKLELPAGFKASPLEYPVPVKFEMPGGIVCYGYHSQVMLMTTITPPADLKMGSEATLSAQTDYLVCEDICLSGKKDVSRIISILKRNDKRNTELFDHWSSLVPVPADKSSVVRSVESDDTSVTVHWNKTPSEVQFFPGGSPAVSIGNITVLNFPDRTQVLFSPKIYDKSKLTPITCVMGFIDPKGIHRAIEFPVSLKNGS